MNTPQRIVVIGATVVLVCMILFPPWTFLYQPPKDTRFTKQTRPAGYHFLLSTHVPEDHTQLATLFGLPPYPGISSPSHFSMEIDSNRLMLQIGAWIVISGLLLFVSKASPKTRNS